MSFRVLFTLRRILLSTAIASIAFSSLAHGQNSVLATSTYSMWPRGPSPDPSFFPIAVWLQNPANAERYRAAGFNTYIGLWRGPTEAQLAALAKAGMRLICEQNKTALQHLDDPTIIGWMHGDEPDNAQELPNHSGYGPPIAPEKIVESYRHLRSSDPSRPVLLNLGQGVAWDGWYGRGSRSRHPEDYREYIQGCDIVSFDIYPVVHDHKDVAGKLNYVGTGVERLMKWTADKPRPVWNCLECTHISNPDKKPSPHDIRAEAWMSLIYGSRGLIYFVHEFKPKFREAALLDDLETLEAVTSLNQQLAELAPVLNESTLLDQAEIRPLNGSMSVKSMLKKHNNTIYLFAVEMSGSDASADFVLKGADAPSTAEVLGENRSLPIARGVFTDSFKPWDVHLYKLNGQPSRGKW
ncbi:MAG TPA: hypothetical protein VL793_16210 [Patescibacteria group bacterium]|nr:hypothetical protein [Patescibacteria group bacterium]